MTARLSSRQLSISEPGLKLRAVSDTSVDKPPRRTTPPGHPVVLYDGHCVFCTRQMKRLARLMPKGAAEAASFQGPGVLDRFPGITWEAALRAMLFVAADGQIYAGAEAAVRALGLRTVGKVAFIYYVPGFRWLCDQIYAVIARNRYRLAGKHASECDGGTCSLHGHEKARPTTRP